MKINNINNNNLSHELGHIAPKLTAYEKYKNYKSGKILNNNSFPHETGHFEKYPSKKPIPTTKTYPHETGHTNGGIVPTETAYEKYKNYKKGKILGNGFPHETGHFPSPKIKKF